MSTGKRPLPTEPGTVIGWSVWHDGPHFGGAVLDFDDDSPAWWVAGFNEPRSPELLASQVSGWQVLGVIAPDVPAGHTYPPKPIGASDV